MPPRKASRSVFGLFPVGAKPTHKSAPRRFRCLLATRGSCDFPVLPRGGNGPLLPCAVLTAVAMGLPTSRAKAGRKPNDGACISRVVRTRRAKKPALAPEIYLPPRQASRFVCGPFPGWRQANAQKVPHAAFVVYLRRGAAAIPPFCLGEETNPFYPCTVPTAVAAGPQTYGIRAGRKPTFRLRFTRVIFRLRANRPSLAAFPYLPPRKASRFATDSSPLSAAAVTGLL